MMPLISIIQSCLPARLFHSSSSSSFLFTKYSLALCVFFFYCFFCLNFFFFLNKPRNVQMTSEKCQNMHRHRTSSQLFIILYFKSSIVYEHMSQPQVAAIVNIYNEWNWQFHHHHHQHLLKGNRNISWMGWVNNMGSKKWRKKTFQGFYLSVDKWTTGNNFLKICLCVGVMMISRLLQIVSLNAISSVSFECIGHLEMWWILNRIKYFYHENEQIYTIFDKILIIIYILEFDRLHYPIWF